MNERDAGWLEGLIDGEGTLALYKAKKKQRGRAFSWAVRIQIANTNLALLERALKILGEGHIRRARSPRPNYKMLYQLAIDSAKGARRVLPNLRFTGKEEQRQLLLEACLYIRHGGNRWRQSNDLELERIYQRLKQLNAKGPAPLGLL